MEMNQALTLTSTIVCVLCVLFTFFHHYSVFHYKHRSASSSLTHEAPLFDDFIPNDVDAVTGLKQYRDEGSLFMSTNENQATSPAEIDNVLRAAVAFRLSGKLRKSLKLFEHAAALAPRDPDVLNRYGEFLERNQKDIVTADELYFKALTYAPDHPQALINRQRTAEIVDRLDSELLRTIDRKRDNLKELFAKDDFESVKKQAYYLHIYHTVGIEGNTMTVDQLQYLLETGQVVAGKSLIEHNEVLGLQLAMKHLKLLTRKNYVTVGDILSVHRRVLGHVDPVRAGKFRDEKVFVGGHAPPPPEEVPHLMDAYEVWLNSDEARDAHPVRYAALAHYKLVDIHPFADGNGRTSRLIMNLILIRAGYPPVMVLKEQREKYYDALNAANSGDVRPFVRFIAECTIRMLDMYINRGKEVMSIEDDREHRVLQTQLLDEN